MRILCIKSRSPQQFVGPLYPVTCPRRLLIFCFLPGWTRLTYISLFFFFTVCYHNNIMSQLRTLYTHVIFFVFFIFNTRWRIFFNFIHNLNCFILFPMYYYYLDSYNFYVTIRYVISYTYNYRETQQVINIFFPWTFRFLSQTNIFSALA